MLHEELNSIRHSLREMSKRIDEMVNRQELLISKITLMSMAAVTLTDTSMHVSWDK